MTGYTFSQLIDFTRTSAATFVNSSGNIASTAQSRNLLTFTQEFDNAAWTKADTTITANSTAAPDGTMTADTLVAAATTAAHTIRQTGGGSGSPHTLSIYAKAGTSNFIQLYHASVSTIYANFNVAAGTVGTVGAGATAAITSVGNGWYRCSITFTPGSVSTSRVAMITSATAVYAESWTAAGTETIFIWGAQLEQASSATDYTRNFGGLFPPRFDYDPVTRAPRGLLIEEQRTNLTTYSGDTTNAVWAATAAAKTSTNNADPFGTNTALLVTADGTNTSHYVQQGPAISFTSGTAYTQSIWVKPGTIDRIQLTFGSPAFGASQYANFFLSGAGSVTAAVGGTATIAQFADGWYRVTFTATATATTSIQGIFVVVITSGTDARVPNNTSAGTFQVIGAQLEAGAFATSYIPTVASQVTRTADAAAINAPNFAGWFNGVEGSLVVELQKLSPSGTATYAWELTGASSNFSMRVRLGTDARLQSVDGGVAVVDAQLAAAVPTTTTKYATAYKLNDYAGSANGAAVATDTSATVPALSALSIGSAGVTNIYVRSIRYYPTKLSNAQLQALTA